jgi:hypothetical protein
MIDDILIAISLIGAYALYVTFIYYDVEQQKKESKDGSLSRD